MLLNLTKSEQELVASLKETHIQVRNRTRMPDDDSDYHISKLPQQPRYSCLQTGEPSREIWPKHSSTLSLQGTLYSFLIGKAGQRDLQPYYGLTHSLLPRYIVSVTCNSYFCLCYLSLRSLGFSKDEAVILSTTFLPRQKKKKAADLTAFHALKLCYRVFADENKVNATTVPMCVCPFLPPLSLVIFESFGYHQPQRAEVSRIIKTLQVL